MRYNRASYAERAYFVQVAASNQSAPKPHPLLYGHLFRYIWLGAHLFEHRPELWRCALGRTVGEMEDYDQIYISYHMETDMESGIRTV